MDEPFTIDVSHRIRRLPPYLFGRLNAVKHHKRQQGIDIIDLGMGNPNDPTPALIVEKLQEAAAVPRNQRYSMSRGVFNLRREVARNYEAAYGVSLDAESEVIVSIGSKEGFSHMCLALLGPGDTALVPNPAFPPHIHSVAMAGANVISLPLADPDLTIRILPLLGTAGKDRALQPLFDLVMDVSVDEGLRRSAAIHLGLAASLSENPAALIAELIENLDHRDPSIRGCCSLALGWEGNTAAVPALMNRLQDPDRDVQAAVVAALSSVNDARVFDRLVERLRNGSLEEQRSVLLNLWRFAERVPDAQRVFRDSLEWLPADLYPDILAALSMIPPTGPVLAIYRRMLSEEYIGIRLQVLENLQALEPLEYAPLNESIRRMLADKDRRVRQAATRLLAGGPMDPTA